MDKFEKSQRYADMTKEHKDHLIETYVARAMKDMNGMDTARNSNLPTKKSLVEAYHLALKDDIRVNDTYQVAIDWDSEENGALSPMKECKVIHLSIKRLDKNPIMDYRDLMTIKDKLVGEEYEALMLYPSRSREHDMANQYHLWIPTERVSGKPMGIPFGWSCGRRVFNESKFGATQRLFKEE
tara:strand:+ start:80 stop:628 length:549 start_codon:yes stop_codon:yes gene_type:complete